ncbi:unnamed protein product [Caretta caretta]
MLRLDKRGRAYDFDFRRAVLPFLMEPWEGAAGLASISCLIYMSDDLNFRCQVCKMVRTVKCSTVGSITDGWIQLEPKVVSVDEHSIHDEPLALISDLMTGMTLDFVYIRDAWFTGDYRINDPRDQDCCWLLRDYIANMSVSAICVKPGIRTASTYKIEENNRELLTIELDKISITSIYKPPEILLNFVNLPFNDKVYQAS